MCVRPSSRKSIREVPAPSPSPPRWLLHPPSRTFCIRVGARTRFRVGSSAQLARGEHCSRNGDTLFIPIATMRNWSRRNIRGCFATSADSLASSKPTFLAIYTCTRLVESTPIWIWRCSSTLAPLLRSLRQKHGANASVIFGQEPLAHAVLLEGRPRQVCNAFIASTPGHPFWLALLKRIVGAPQRGFGDPVSSTGPRMLERVVRQWRGGGVLIADPDVFYPTWDPMQSNTFRERCTVTTRRRPSLPAQVRDVPLQMRERVCQRLRREGFRPVVSKAAYTNHLWTHTWINGATKVSLHDVYRLDTSGGANVPSGRRPRRQNRTAFLRSRGR